MEKDNRYLGSHEIQGRRDEVKGGTDRNFGVVFAVVFGLVGIWSLYVGGRHWAWWLGGSAIFALLAWLAPAVLSPFNKLWTKFGLLLFHIVNPIVLGLLFYLCILPIGLLLRLTGKELLSLRFQPGAKSYWIERKPPGPARDSFPNQF